MTIHAPPPLTEDKLRLDLATTFRLADRFGWTESVGNHFSAVLSRADGTFLMNPKWKHFSAICARDLLLLNWHEADTLSRPNPPDRSGWCIHSRMHALMPDAAVILHIHPPYATALAGLKDPTIAPIDQVTARFFESVAMDLAFTDVAITEAEGDRLAAVMGDKQILLMGNHGVSVAAESIAHAFEELYLFERACRTLVLAYGTGQPLSVMSDPVARTVRAGWSGCRDMALEHFYRLQAKLLAEDPGLAD